MLTRTLLVVCLVLGLCCPMLAGDLSPAAESKLAVLNSIAQPMAWSWRHKVGDFPDAANAAFDDSSWKVEDAGSFQWGKGPVCWFRTKITVPSEIAGVKVAGSKITFKCGVRDNGLIYLDGAQKQEFKQDSGSVVLTSSAQPGQVFVIALRIDAGRRGGLSSSRLEFSGVSDVAADVDKMLASYKYARMVYDASDATKRVPYLGAMNKALESVDLEAFNAGKNDAFRGSLETGRQELKKTGELVRGLNVDLVAHAHIDMNWLWLWPETIDICKNTFTTMTKLMDEYPEFKFSQSQPAAYLAMQENAPELFAKIKEKVKNGQWDVSTAACWVEGDLNMPSGEAIARSILYGKRYMMKEFGVEPAVCWAPDTFGHAWTIPQILAKSGVDYYYFWRKGPGPSLFWWQSPDGSKVLAFNYKEYWGRVDEGDVLKRAIEFTKKTGSNDYMHIYGVGDHGGGPTKVMLDNATALEKRDDFPKIKFSSAKDYFETVLKSKHDFPVWNSEMNPIFEGCYTSHSDIKRWNRECENALATAETFSALATTCKVAYPTKAFEDSWRKTCFNQFHDILDGTAIRGSYEYSGTLRDAAVKQAESATDASLNAMLPQIKTAGKGTPIVVFNPLSWTRTDAVSVPSPFTGGGCAKVTDETGKAYPARVFNGKLCFTAHSVPAVGYRVFWASEVAEPIGAGVKVGSTSLENQFFQVQIDPVSGAISGIVDKATGRQVVAEGGAASLLQVLMESPKGGSAWDFATISGTEDLNKAGTITVAADGQSKGTVSIEHAYRKSLFNQEVTLYEDVPRIDIHMRADWQEICNDNPTPALKVAFQTSVKNGKATYEIPFGSIERRADGKEQPSQKWIDLSGPNYGVSILNDCKYGFDIKDNVLRATLLRSSFRPDPVPDKGIHDITYSIYPHSGDWRAAGTVRRGYELNQPLVARVATAHSGSLPSTRSYVSISEKNLVVTALKQAEDDGSLILRFYETDGKPCKARVWVNTPARAVVETDILERPIGKEMILKKKQFTSNVGKNEIKTYKILR